ncbi:MAG: DUF2304 domain-containing protein [Gemmatales bacterium]|nr:DUF2304 domain-containing protein [Gemmatales bacterium]MCS7160986.1 DUF2304 domain-containing protein [Gemmatales bacterium]MDW8176189.1 DUF2304 domain-containing protein [Gemmatales bacterium]MDW8221760.1 DUF2304 domain-containing protein [Gemmatales bacterium]
MTAFQWITVPTLLALFLWDMWHLGRGPLTTGSRLLRMTLWLSAALAILRPDWVQKIAEWLGIGLGANLVLYLFALAFLWTSFFLYSRIVRLRQDVTDVVRQLAILRAERGGGHGAPS